MILALFEPDIPQNTGSMIRLCACLGVKLHIIEPCGFPLDDKQLRRVAMDYASHISIVRHSSWQAFLLFKNSLPAARLLLLTTKSELSYTDFSYQPHDILLLGRESAGVPLYVTEAADACVTIPMQQGARSLNVAMSAAIVVSEALRQLGHSPKL